MKTLTRSSHAVGSLKVKPKNKLQKIFSSWQLYVLLLPSFAYVLIFSYFPMYGIVLAFKNFRAVDGILGSPWVGLDHFVRFLNYPFFWQVVKNTLVLSLYSIATFPCAVILALLINEVDSRKYKKTVQMVTYAPHFISVVVLVGMINLFFGRSYGLINNVIEFIRGHRVDFLSKPEYFPHIYVWSGVWQSVGWGTIIYLSALSSVSPEMVEAAIVDGASRFKIIWHINIPTILPTIVIMLILSCGSILSVGFEKVYLLKNPLNADTAQVISTYVYEIGLKGSQFSYATAIGFFNTLVNVIFLLIVNRIAKRASGYSIW